MRGVAASLALALAPWCAHAQQPPVGETRTYVRSDIGGGEEEWVSVHRPARDRLAVYKMRARCTNAALVTAEVDPATGEARRLVGGRLTRSGQQAAFAEMRFDAQARTLTISGDGLDPVTIAVASAPWRLFDFDLADFTGPATPADFTFGFALAWPGEDGLALRSLGRVEARFVGTEAHLGRPAYRYDVAGAMFEGGPLWLDAERGHVLEARWKTPNHPGYRDFQLRLLGIEQGEAAWRARLAGHWAGCPPPPR